MRRLLALVGCGLLTTCTMQRDEAQIVARVEDTVLTIIELEDQLPDQPDEELASAERRQFIDEWIEQELLYQEALNLEVHKNARIHRLIEQARRDLVVASFLDSVFQDHRLDISEEAVVAYYQSNQNSFERTEAEVRVQHILLATKRDADLLRQNLLQGDPFEKAAEEYSLDQETKTIGGDIGYITAKDLPALWDKCQNLALGVVSKPVSTERGYHIIRVLAREPAGSVKAPEQVRSEIIEALVLEDYRRRFDEFIDHLKDRHFWEISAK